MSIMWNNQVKVFSSCITGSCDLHSWLWHGMKLFFATLSSYRFSVMDTLLPCSSYLKTHNKALIMVPQHTRTWSSFLTVFLYHLANLHRLALLPSLLSGNCYSMSYFCDFNFVVKMGSCYTVGLKLVGLSDPLASASQISGTMHHHSRLSSTTF